MFFRRVSPVLAWLGWIVAALVPGTALAKVGIGDPFPTWTLLDLAGNEVHLGSEDRVCLLYFLGSGCTLCADLASRIDTDFVQGFTTADVGVYAIDSLDGTVDELERLRNEAGVRFPFLRDGSELTAACGISWHAIVVLDDRGTIRYLTEGANAGIYDPSGLRETIDHL
ncbi:MAG: redoxin domain-containing protein, partial [Candidatus Eisenbacteria bacterium]|nr:redoxin domain-containing protein [Candidatus Eisenbacteria bacterium]